MQGANSEREGAVKLTIGEQIMIYRTRAGLTQKEFARRAFPNLMAPHMKVQKIEGGRQAPTSEDLAAMAKVLNLSSGELSSMEVVVDMETSSGTKISEKVLQAIPKIGTYLNALNSIAALEDTHMLKVMIAAMCKDRELMAAAGDSGTDEPNGARP